MGFKVKFNLLLMLIIAIDITYVVTCVINRFHNATFLFFTAISFMMFGVSVSVKILKKDYIEYLRTKHGYKDKNKAEQSIHRGIKIICIVGLILFGIALIGIWYPDLLESILRRM